MLLWQAGVDSPVMRAAPGADDVVVHLGLALVRTDARQIANVEVLDDVADPPKKLGPSATELIWTFADSETKRIAIANADLDPSH